MDLEVVDFATQKVINQIKLPELPADKQNRHRAARAVARHCADRGREDPAGQQPVANSTLYAYSVPDLKLLGGVPLGGKGAGWLVITPDDKTAYVANEHTNDVSVVDIKSLKEVALVPDVQVQLPPATSPGWPRKQFGKPGSRQSRSPDHLLGGLLLSEGAVSPFSTRWSADRLRGRTAPGGTP